MNKTTPIYRDCTEYCKSTTHGDLITSAITKRSVSDPELCSYLNYICTNCESTKDSIGRTALHVASSCGRIDLVRWLIKIRNANINIKDESGYTPLHRALFYGKINVAVELMKEGACINIFDTDSLTPIEHVVQDGQVVSGHYGSLYTWGLNNNNSLGSFNSRSTPELLDIFHKRYPNALVKSVCIDKFHSVILTTNGEVYSCGHGLGGRLGLGTEQTNVVPTKINFQSNEKVSISQVSIAKDHCVFLSTDCMLYSCGSNKYKVLGLSPPPEKVMVAQKIKQTFSKNVEGISTGKYHSCAWTPTLLYAWGLNVGQLGQEPVNGNYNIITPKPVNSINANGTYIQKVASSDGAIVVSTGRGDIYVIYGYQCKKIASRLLNVTDVAVIGGKINVAFDKSIKEEPLRELKVVVQTNVGSLFLWQESDPQLCRCIFSIPRNIIVKQTIININEILFVTNFGEAYRAVIKPRKKKTVVEKKSAFHNFLIKDECVTLKLTKIPKIYRAIWITSDPRGEDYCVIQQNPANEGLFQNDGDEFQMNNQLSILLNEANQDDNIHDIRIRIGERIFPAHKYILAHKCDLLKNPNNGKEIVLDNSNCDLFEQMLIFIYTEDCELIHIGRCPERFRHYCSNDMKIEATKPNEKKNKTIQNPIRKLQEIAKKHGCNQLYKLLSSFDMQGDLIYKKDPSPYCEQIVYDMKNYPEFHDVVIRCSDNIDVKAHRCVLAARLEYFNNMFSMRWNMAENATINIQYPSNLVEGLLEFLYTNSTKFLLKKDCDFLLRLLVLADEYMVDQLKDNCASIITLFYLDLKNAVEILQFSHYYKSNSLKQAVLKYIVNNMAYLLEIRAFDDLGDDILNDLTEKYFEQKRQLCCRVITPYSSAVGDEEIQKIHTDYPVNLEVPEIKKVDKTPIKYSKRRSRTKTSAVEGIVEKVVEETQNPDSFIQFPDLTDVPEIVPDTGTKKRLSAISYAMEKLQYERNVPDFTNLNDSVTSTSSWNDFPLLGSSQESSFYATSPPSYKKTSMKQDGKHKMVKLSQKERKRLSSESKEMTQIIPESPKNPWKTLGPETNSPVGLQVNDSQFCNILNDERKLKDNLVKITNKLLIHTQMEDKAIDELGKFYCIESIEDELITIERVDIGCVALPVWVSRSKSSKT